MKTNYKDVINGSLLIAGTTIGAGMLGIPAVTGQAGFLPATIITVLVWLYMVCTGMLFLEATLWMHKDANVLSMTNRFLGKAGKLFAGSTFIFLYYCLMIAYFAAGAPIFTAFLKPFFVIAPTSWISYTLFGLVFALIVGFGIKFIGHVNYLLMIILVVSFLVLIGVEIPKIELPKLEFQNWKNISFAAPMLFSAFGFHNIIPSLTFHFKENGKSMRLAILFGTLIPLFVYLIWQAIIIGIIPTETITKAMQEGAPITQTMQILTQKWWVHLSIRIFSLFAIITSIIGVSFSIVDFLGDGLKLKRKGFHRFLLCLLTFIPPLVFTTLKPSVFLLALGIAGGFGEAFLNGILPAWLVWRGRYHKKLPSDYRLLGGRITLLAIFLLGIIVIGLTLFVLIKE